MYFLQACLLPNNREINRPARGREGCLVVCYRPYEDYPLGSGFPEEEQPGTIAAGHCSGGARFTLQRDFSAC